VAARRPASSASSPGLLGQFARRGERGILDRAVGSRVARPGRDLEEDPLRRGAVLADQDDLVAVERHDRHGAGMVDDLAFAARPVGELDGLDTQAHDATLVDRALGHPSSVQAVVHRAVL